MKIKKGDNVIIIAGKDKGKSGKVVSALPKKNAIVVEGLNMRKKHQRAQRQGEKGRVVEFAVPMNISNVMLLVDGKPTRVGAKVVGDKKMRVSKKTGKTI